MFEMSTTGMSDTSDTSATNDLGSRKPSADDVDNVLLVSTTSSITVFEKKRGIKINRLYNIKINAIKFNIQ